MLLRLQHIAPLQGALCGLVDSINMAPNGAEYTDK